MPLDHGTSAIRQLLVSATSMSPDPSIVTPFGAFSKELPAAVPLPDIPDAPVELPATV